MHIEQRCGTASTSRIIRMDIRFHVIINQVDVIERRERKGREGKDNEAM